MTPLLAVDPQVTGHVDTRLRVMSVGVLWGKDRDMSTKQTRISSPYDMQISAIDKLQRAQYNCESIPNRQFMPEYYLQGMRVRSKNHQVATMGETSGSITFGADLPEPSPDVLRNHLVTDSSILPPPSRSPTYPACKSSTLACRSLRPSSTRLPAGRLIDYSSSEDEAEEQQPQQFEKGKTMAHNQRKGSEETQE